MKKPLPICKGFFFIGFILIQITSYAQFFDSIETSLTYKPVIDFKIESRNSFFANEWAAVSGVRIGLDYHKTFKVGVGYNWLRKEVQHTIFVNEKPYRADYFFHYGVVYGEYAFYKVKPFTMSIYASIGGGKAWDSYIDTNGNRQNANNSLVIVYEPYMTGTVDVLKYFAVGGGMGYRLVATSNKFSRNKLNTLIYVFKLQIKLDKIIKDFDQYYPR